jgi:hypothetical protein
MIRAGDVQRYQQITDELDLGHGPEWTEIKHLREISSPIRTPTRVTR